MWQSFRFRSVILKSKNNPTMVGWGAPPSLGLHVELGRKDSVAIFRHLVRLFIRSRFLLIHCPEVNVVFYHLLPHNVPLFICLNALFFAQVRTRARPIESFFTYFMVCPDHEPTLGSSLSLSLFSVHTISCRIAMGCTCPFRFHALANGLHLQLTQNEASVPLVPLVSLPTRLECW